MNRQQRRAQQRAQKAQPVYTPTTEAAYQDGWKAACDFCMKTCYAAAVTALHTLEGYGHKRSMRFLKAMDGIVVNTLTSEEAIDNALEKAGVRIQFREAFAEDRIIER